MNPLIYQISNMSYKTHANTYTCYIVEFMVKNIHKKMTCLTIEYSLGV